jgi:hypothetical protein
MDEAGTLEVADGPAHGDAGCAILADEVGLTRETVPILPAARFDGPLQGLEHDLVLGRAAL